MNLLEMKRKEPKIPAFLAPEDPRSFAELERGMATAVTTAPRGMADPMHPDVAKLLSAGIVAVVKKGTDEIVEDLRQEFEAAEHYLENVEQRIEKKAAEAEQKARDREAPLREAVQVYRNECARALESAERWQKDELLEAEQRARDVAEAHAAARAKHARFFAIAQMPEAAQLETSPKPDVE